MKILMLCYEFPPIGGGGSRVVDGLTRELTVQGHEVDLITMAFGELPRRETKAGVRIHRVPCVRFKPAVCTLPEMVTYVISALWKVLQLLKANRYDIVHTHFVLPDGLVAWLMKHLTGRRYVITAHGSDVPGYNPDRFKLMHKLLTPLWQQIVRAADCIICPSLSLQALLRKHSQNVRSVIIPNGFSPQRYRADRPKENRVLLVSRLFERKGVQYLLEAAAHFHHGYTFDIVGDGPYRGTLEKLAKALGADVRFWGWLDQESQEFKELYETSSIFVFPSVAENFPVVLLEAMASGLAIITTKGTGSAEVVGDTALMVEMRDAAAIRGALQRLVADQTLQRRCRVRARRRLEEHFSWPHVTRQYVDIYEKERLPA